MQTTTKNPKIENRLVSLPKPQLHTYKYSKPEHLDRLKHSQDFRFVQSHLAPLLHNQKQNFIKIRVIRFPKESKKLAGYRIKPGIQWNCLKETKTSERKTRKLVKSEPDKTNIIYCSSVIIGQIRIRMNIL